MAATSAGSGSAGGELAGASVLAHLSALSSALPAWTAPPWPAPAPVPASRPLPGPTSSSTRRYIGCSANTLRLEYGYESHHVPCTHVSFTGSSWIMRSPAAAATSTSRRRSANSPQPSEDALRRANTGEATPAPRQGRARRTWPPSHAMALGISSGWARRPPSAPAPPSSPSSSPSASSSLAPIHSTRASPSSKRTRASAAPVTPSSELAASAPPPPPPPLRAGASSRTANLYVMGLDSSSRGSSHSSVHTERSPSRMRAARRALPPPSALAEPTTTTSSPGRR